MREASAFAVVGDRLSTRVVIIATGLCIGTLACTARPNGPTLTGDWDVYVAYGSTARAGFEGWRRMGFAHFDARQRRARTEPFADAPANRCSPSRASVRTRDSVVLAGDEQSSTHGRGTATRSLASCSPPATRRPAHSPRPPSEPFVAEKIYDLWPGAVSDSSTPSPKTRPSS